MRSQDIITALVLVLEKRAPTYAALGQLAGLSASEAHASVKRLRAAGIVDGDRHVVRRALLDFLVHGAPFAFPGSPGGLALGLPTGGAAPGLGAAPAPEKAPLVWPTEQGSVRGLALEPLHPTVPQIALADPRLYTLLAAVDLLRCHPTARERTVATAVLEKALSYGIIQRIMDSGTPGVVRGADALEQVFAHHRVVETIRLSLRGGSTSDDLVVHPYERALLIRYQDAIAHRIASSTRTHQLAPSAAYVLLDEKADGSARTHVYPSLLDRIVALRLVEALEPRVRSGDGDRVFLPRRHASGSMEDPVYADTGGQWQAFVESVEDAARAGHVAFALRTDVQEFFGSIDLGAAREAVARVTGAHPIAIALLFRMLEVWSPRIGYRAARGLPIEPTDASRLVAHCLLKAVDEQFEDDFEIRYRRFMDDAVVFTDSLESANRVRERHRRALEALGLRHNVQKTEPLPVADYLQRTLALDAHAQLDGVSSAEDLETLLFDWAFSVRETPHGGVLRRLYGIAGAYASRALMDRVAHDIGVRGLLSAVLKYACRWPLSPTHTQLLADRLFADGTPQVDRVRIAAALADARFANNECGPLVDRAIAWIRSDEEPGAARAHLIYFVYKHAPDRAQDVLSVGMDAAADPYVAIAVWVVARALGRELAAMPQFAFSANGSSDSGLVQLLVDDLEGHGARNISQILDSGMIWRHGHLTLTASYLPLLRIAARARSEGGGEEFDGWCSQQLGAEPPLVDGVLRRHIEEQQLDGPPV